MKVNLSIDLGADTDATGKAVANAVRRALGDSDTLTVGTKGFVKGVQYSVKASPKNTVKPSLANVREWAASEGIVLGKRGRIPANVLADFAAAQKA